MAAVSDSIADMFTRIRNGIQARHQRVDMPSSKLKAEVARILKDEGYISSYKVNEEGKKKVSANCSPLRARRGERHQHDRPCFEAGTPRLLCGEGDPQGAGGTGSEHRHDPARSDDREASSPCRHRR